MRAAAGTVAWVGIALGAGCFDSENLQRMDVQRKALPYGESAVFADGRAMRMPPGGTVARERLADLALDFSHQPDGGYVSQNPLPLTPALLSEGRHKFEIVCATCHGLLGNGESMAAQNMSLRPPPDLHAYRDRPDGYFYQVITHGFGLMPEHGRELTAHQRWAIVAYVRALQLSQHAPLELAPEPERQKLEVSP